MSSLLAKLKAGTRNVKVIKFPGHGDVKVAIRVLSNREIQEAEFAAERLFREEKIEYGPSTVEAHEKEKTMQQLHRALRDPENPEAYFAASADELRALLTQDEKDALVREYLEFQDECSPDLDAMSEGEFNSLLEEVKKRPEAASNVSSISLLRRLVTSLASRPPSSRTDNGSTSS